MLTQAQYDSFIRKGQINIVLIFLVVALLAAICCIVISKKYVSPILRKIEKVKSKEDSGGQIHIREIDDLFDFLEQKDNNYERQLESLENEKKFAEEEARKAKDEYEKASKKYELAKSTEMRLFLRNTISLLKTSVHLLLLSTGYTSCIFRERQQSRLLKLCISPRTPSSITTRTSTASWVFPHANSFFVLPHSSSTPTAKRTGPNSH